MSKLSTKRDINSLALLCAMVYFISYISRINLSAVMVEVVSSGFAPQTTAALALTVNSITYGSGQLVSGYLGDKYKPQNIILAGFLLTGCVNICVGLLPVSAPLVALWAVNGFAQALMWPPIVKILVSHMDTDAYAARFHRRVSLRAPGDQPVLLPWRFSDLRQHGAAHGAGLEAGI